MYAAGPDRTGGAHLHIRSIDYDQSCPWVGLTHGLGWAGLGWVGLSRDFSVFGGLGWVGSTAAKVLKFERISLMHLKHG